MGRPKIEIDKKDFEGLLAIQCTLEEIVSFFDHKLGKCSADTIERWCKREYGETFAVVSGKKRNIGKISLRRSQFRLAEKNVAMAIFLGKNYLGQSDTVKYESRADGKLAELIDGLKEPFEDDIHTETKSTDASVAD